MKRFKIIFGIIILILPYTLISFQDNKAKVRTVVIDAGHGGNDPGALGITSKEKDITLKIALKVGQYINENLPDVNVIYTRKTDKAVKLIDRAKIANNAKADLFISIHCNANTKTQPYGSETYVMGLDVSAKNLEVAKRENAVILKEENYQEDYGGFDPNSTEAYIIFRWFQNTYQKQSINFASKIQTQFRERVGRRDRGVKQERFFVLYRTAMPAVLIETGFISNVEEEKYLNSEKGQVYLASAIYRAFKEYKKEIEANNEIEVPRSNNDTVQKQIETSTQQEKQPEVYFTVQFYGSEKELSVKDSKFANVDHVFQYQYKGMYRYCSKKFNSMELAVKHQRKLKRLGYRDAFVIAFKGNERITNREAKTLLR